MSSGSRMFQITQSSFYCLCSVARTLSMSEFCLDVSVSKCSSVFWYKFFDWLKIYDIAAWIQQTCTYVKQHNKWNSPTKILTEEEHYCFNVYGIACLCPYRRTYAQCCNVCYPLFLFIILAACVMACAGLVWMQIALKEDLDALKEKLQSSKAAVSNTHLVTIIKSFIILNFIATVVFNSSANMVSCFVTVESSQKASSSEIPKLSEDLKNKERKLDDFENGDKGLNKLWSNLTEINRKVRLSTLRNQV